MKRSDPLLWIGALAVIVGWVAVLTTSGGGDEERPNEETVVAGVCSALEASEDGGDPRAVFYDRAHEGLHGLAAETSAQDRRVAAALLRSKERVEELLDEPPGPETTDALRTLSKAAAEAVSVVDPGSDEQCR